jgi:hypothetical protein
MKRPFVRAVSLASMLVSVAVIAADDTTPSTSKPAATPSGRAPSTGATPEPKRLYQSRDGGGADSWSFKLAPNSGPTLESKDTKALEPALPDASITAPRLFDIRTNTRVLRKGVNGEPIMVELPRSWWIGDYLTPLEKSRLVIPPSNKVR